jgi:hypothetical protein
MVHTSPTLVIGLPRDYPNIAIWVRLEWQLLKLSA